MDTQKAQDLSKAFGFLLPEEIDCLVRIVKKLPERSVIINIGAGVGTSSLTIAESRPDLLPFTVTVDISPESPLGGLKNERNAFENAGLKMIPIQVLCDSVWLAKVWRGSVEFVLIDGGHLIDEVYGDLTSWVPKVVPGGVIGVHDMDGKWWSEVPRVTYAMLADFEIIDKAGGYVFFRKPLKFGGFPYDDPRKIP